MLIKRLKAKEVYVVFVDKVLGRALICIRNREDRYRDRRITPFTYSIETQDTSVVRCREYLKRKCKNLKLITEAKDYEVYSFDTKVKSQRAALIRFSNGGPIVGPGAYMVFEDGRHYDIPIKYVIQCIKNKTFDFVDIGINSKGEVYYKPMDYRKCREWLDADKCHNEFWGYLEEIGRLNEAQRVSIKKEILSDEVFDKYDKADMISLFTHSEQWFPSKFWGLATIIRDWAFRIMEEYNIAV